MASLVRRLGFACLIVVAAATTTAATAAETSGLPLPRFVSLRTDEVNLRTGPGTRYPVEWVYTRRDLPVEVIAEFDVWRKIRDWQGTEGWVHQTMLSARRMAVVTGAERPLRSEPDDKAVKLALIGPNVVGRLMNCPRDKRFCRVEIGTLHGWLKREEFWGVYPNEFIE